MKTTLAVIALILAPSLALACPAHEQHAMSCAEGMVMDMATGTCVPQVSS
ncbi:hypothetical protein RXV86_03725 [Alisedimentitalea sp. MJ-SS2]|nr:hypothetical protein [Alisedimentitalea sp. MJ-SS2]MDU8926487.1 hypothetical protein [Alisedimentitalea sp. MJ-SS2]